MKKFILLFATLSAAFLSTSAQKVSAFEHLDIGVTLGTTGVGIDVATPLSEQFRVRAGFSFVPEFDVKMNFDMDGENGSNVNSVADKFADLTGLAIDDNIDMIGQPNIFNGNLLVDFYPIKNVNFHVTAGFYVGSSRIASACNAIEDMATLVSASMYNNIYDNIEAGEPIFGDVYLSPELEEKFLSYGRMGVHLGNRVDTGEPYIMEPDENSTVKVDVFVNSFKPYLGVGYGGKLAKNNDCVRIAFDAGVMFWGGAPKVVTHDGVDLVRDVENIGGKVGEYISIAKALQVYPVLNLKLSFRVF
ncbi:MAG: hypothetical protein IIV86_07380 [Bacteroidaceae bacterium]|nr:hypothetical protein [Bacteroidaceae bacterium]